MKTASCFGPAHILLPGENIPLEKWGCVACDQFTSDRAYWEQADAVVGGCPSTPAFLQMAVKAAPVNPLVV